MVRPQEGSLGCTVPVLGIMGIVGGRLAGAGGGQDTLPCACTVPAAEAQILGRW